MNNKGGYEKPAIELIAEERQRQVEVEGWTAEHDAEHKNGEMAIAAACYAYPNYDEDRAVQSQLEWPWDNKWWKPTPDNRIRELVKAGALIVAEIERLSRIEDNKQPTPEPEIPAQWIPKKGEMIEVWDDDGEKPIPIRFNDYAEGSSFPWRGIHNGEHKEAFKKEGFKHARPIEQPKKEQMSLNEYMKQLEDKFVLGEKDAETPEYTPKEAMIKFCDTLDNLNDRVHALENQRRHNRMDEIRSEIDTCKCGQFRPGVPMCGRTDCNMNQKSEKE